MRVRVGATTRVRSRSKTVTVAVTRERMDRGTAAQNEAVVLACVQSLGRLGDPAALWPLMDLVEERDELELGSAAAWAIGAIGTDAAGVFLGDLARDEEPLRRAWAAAGLGALEGAEAARILWTLADDADAEVRRAALAGLGGRNHGETAEAIGRRLASRDPGRRELALDVLGRHVASGRVTEEQLASLQAAVSGDRESPAAPEVQERLAALLARVRRPGPPVREAPDAERAEGPVAAARPTREAPRSLAAEVTPEGIFIFLPVKHRVLETADAGTPGGP